MGASLAYFVVMPTAFHFFLEFQGDSSGLSVEALPSADAYLGLVMQLENAVSSARGQDTAAHTHG